ncbi:ABC transporter ATP-binding protein [Plantactinospora soyae]|uniref:ABC transport system ATP-binding protein n=1 Tax=Plantactinospora soyae TaxID=1544732 RepID=A0A927MA60_9ACTN|nr:ABC transporter ATP-binding protein [Plantactinospora soyae]MBE1489431.1 putative ABC transport system ATP-binding protein [Plantactinospora soyae]
MPDEAVIILRGARKSFRQPNGAELLLLSDVDLTVGRGESLAVRGRSGSGKTTLLRSLGLFLPFDAGEHRLLGVDVRSAGDRRCSALRAHSIGFVFQDFRLLPNLTALQNVEYAGILAGMSRQRRSRAARAALGRVGLSDRLHSRPAHLSGGEQQRVAIARALVKRPALVLADEPTGALDGDTADDVIELLLDAVTELRTALVVVTHDDAVAERCDRRVRLADGTLQVDATPTPVPGGG